MAISPPRVRAAEVTKGTSDDSHLAGDSKQSEKKHFAGMAAEVTQCTSDDTHLADSRPYILEALHCKASRLRAYCGQRHSAGAVDVST